MNSARRAQWTVDPTRAEAVSALVSARSRRAAQWRCQDWMAIQVRINGLRERLLDQLTELEARVISRRITQLDGDAVLNELVMRGAAGPDR